MYPRTDSSALAGQFGNLSIGQQRDGMDERAAPLAPLNAATSTGRSPNPSVPSYARSPSQPSFSSAPAASYSAANRPRPQLSPVLTSAPPRGYQLSDGPSPSASSSTYHGNTVAITPLRVPRKSSLPALRDAYSNIGPQPPLPPLPHSASAHAQLASQTPATQRHPSAREQVFNGTVLAAGQPAPHPSRSASSTMGAKRANPLDDLIATETAYVDDLGVIIKRVAAAWSRANFPPPVLDSMFRAVEAVYRVNKGLLAKLLEIGPSPSSPKALGDLLMRWIDEIEPAYTRYAATLQGGFDVYGPVQSNDRLAPILASLPWPNTLPAPEDGDSRAVRLDSLFTLPVVRVAYYQRLYTKLLRSTQEGRSDHALLVSANEKLRRLAQQCDEAQTRTLDEAAPTRPLVPSVPATAGAVSEQERKQVVQPPPQLARLELDLAGPGAGVVGAEPQLQAVQGHSSEVARSGANGSGAAGLDSPSSSSYRSSGATGISTADTSATNAAGHAAAPLRVGDLEHRLDPARALDIFTMQPRKCKLQMQPPSLSFQRQMRKSGPVSLSFVPSSDPSGTEVNIARAHLVLLTDLLLVCAPVETSDLHAASPGADYWLLYPPLAGKHLRVQEGDASGSRDNFVVTIMRKERLTFRPLDAGAQAGDEQETERQVVEWCGALDEAIRFGAAQGSRQNSTMSANSAGGGGTPPISPTYRSSPLSPSFQASVQSPTAPNSTIPSPHLTTSISSSSANGHLHAQPSSPVPSSGNSIHARPALQLMPPASPGLPSRTHSSSSSGHGPAAIARPERNASMLSSGSQFAPVQAPQASGGYIGGGYVQSPIGMAFPHLPVGNEGSSRGVSPYPGSDSSAYGRHSPYGQQHPSYPSPNGTHEFAPPPPLQHGQYANSTYPMPRSPHSARDGPSPSYAGSSRPSSRQSNGSYASSQAYPEFDPRGAAPPPLPKERSYNGVDISGRGGPLYPTSLQGSMPSRSGSGFPPVGPGAQPMHRARSVEGLRSPPSMQHLANGHGHGHGGAGGFGSQYRMPSQTLLEDRSSSVPGLSRSASGAAGGFGRGVGLEFSPPTSPTEERAPQRPDDRTSVVAQMRCKIFLQQHHSVWKSLGTGKLKLYHSLPSGTKQLVVDSDKGGGKTVISTIVLMDGVERVGKTGVAIELSDQGDRTGIVYMLQMKTEQSATGLFEQLLLGTDRAKR